MPSSETKNQPFPISNVSKHPQQVNGFYVHSSPPKVLQVHSSIIRQWLRSGDLNQLEQLVLDGQGHKLVGEYSSDAKVRAFLKQIPAFLVKTKRLHDAIVKGDLKQLQKLLNSIKSHESPMKNIHMSRNQSGLGLLHEAVYYGHPHIAEFLVSNFPQSIHMKDNDGKTPLHYCGASKEAGKLWPILTRLGADPNAVDSKGRRPGYYMDHSNEIQLPEEKILSGTSVSSTSDRNNNMVIKPSNVRIWIHDRDLGKLQQMIWEGHGAKLRVETSKHLKVKRFLEGVPYILNIIKDVHSSVVNNDYEEFSKKTAKPVPIEILGSKDVNGLTPLHKAAGLNRWQIATDILNRNPNLVFSTDQEGKSPLHYAAALKDGNAMYNLLRENEANETAADKNGKMAAYYRTYPKEITMKLLEVIPEAPRTSATFPRAFDWSLYCSETTPPIKTLYPNKDSSAKMAESPVQDVTTSHVEVNELEFPSDKDKRNEASEDSQSEQSASKDISSVTESESILPVEKSFNEVIKEPEENKNFDIWTNDNYDDDVSNKENKEEENTTDNHENINESEERETNEEDVKESVTTDEEFISPVLPNSTQVSEETEKVREQKTEREIAEERQRLLDEGLLKIKSEDEVTDEASTKVNEIIEAGDMEKLASMVLNGEGNKLLGKVSSNPEIQHFLDNVPTYVSKISAVHAAAKNGSLKDLQAALDRRKFAVAKDVSDEMGATPLHEAIVHGSTPIIKYLGGRFPETLSSKDNFGRTPLHYAAIVKDNHIYDTLLDLGADPNMEDNEGHTAAFYQDHPEEMTKEKLLKGMKMGGVAADEEKPIVREVSTPVTDPSVHDAEPEIFFDEGIPLSKNSVDEDAEDDNHDNNSQASFNITDRDEYGQSVLHFAAARAHGRGGLFQLIHESGINLGYRDELYRTARDIAQQANIPENVHEIDKYVISMAAKGETGKLVELFLEGYEHILDLEDDKNNDIVTIVSNRNLEKTLSFLKAIPTLEEKRERIHKAIRAGDSKSVEDIISQSKNGGLLIRGKNTSGRCSLHVAVLCQHTDTTEFIAQKYPETLKIGDNLERTPLHYAMGVEDVETLSKILIKCGAKRVVKDLKGRQPTYYFMNKVEILKLQEEENVLRR